MSNFIQALESRTLLSANPAVVTLRTDEAAVKAALKTIATEGSPQFKTIAADIKAASLLATDKGQLKTLSRDFKKYKAVVGKLISAAGSKVNSDVAKLLSAEAKLAKKPGNETLTAKVAAARTALTTDAAARLTALSAAFQGTTLIADLMAIISDGGTPGTDAGNALNLLSTDGTALSTSANTAFSTDITAFLAS